MKRILTMALAIIMTLGMAACGTNTSTKPDTPAEPSQPAAANPPAGTNSAEKQHMVLMMYTSTAIQEEFEQLHVRIN